MKSSKNVYILTGCYKTIHCIHTVHSVCNKVTYIDRVACLVQLINKLKYRQTGEITELIKILLLRILVELTNL